VNADIDIILVEWRDVVDWPRFDGSLNEVILRGRVETLRREAVAIARRAMESVQR